MTHIELINYFLASIPKLQDKGGFADESDLSFLEDYFVHSKVYFSLMDNLDRHENNLDSRISETQYDDVTNSVRRVSKKYKDAAKLLHILKKSNFKALFNTLLQLDNREYILEPYIGELHEISMGFKPIDQSEDTQNYKMRSESISDSSEESEEILNTKISLPAYQDIQYTVSKNDDDYSNFQIIGLHRDNKQPLGITVIKHDFEYNDSKLSRCMVERILVNSLIDKQGLLQIGDIIFEVNDRPAESPEALLNLLSKCTGTINFKIMKSVKRPMSNMINMDKSFVRALFDYDPSKDTLIPSESIGLSFKCGDVFEILNRDDPNFWQALRLGCTNDQALLVPSQLLQERRIALEEDMKLQLSENHSSLKVSRRKSKKNSLFRAQDSADIISEADLRTYEEVVKFPPSRVPCLLILGPPGLGKKAIKHILVQKEQNRFAFPIPDTTEPKRGRNQALFNHIERNTMLNDIKSSHYVFIEEKAGEMYGVKSSAIRELINLNKTVVFDCRPKDVYSMKLPVFNPFVILITAPPIDVLESMQKEGLQRDVTKNRRSPAELQEIVAQSAKFETLYRHLINVTIRNDGIMKTVQRISATVSEFESSASWVPAAWENDMLPLPTVPREVHRDSVKSPDNLSIGQTTLQRRFEKKNEKTSLPLPEPKAAVVGRSRDQFLSDSSSSLSDDELVKARPLYYAVNVQDATDDAEPIPIKPRQRTSVTAQPKPDAPKEDRARVKEPPQTLPKGAKVAQTPKESGVSVKYGNNVSVKKSIDLKEKECVRGVEREVVKGVERDPIKSQTKEKDVVKGLQSEPVKSQSREKPPPSNTGQQKVKVPPKRIQMKESSSDMSDTTSEEDSRGMRENRV